MKTNSPTFYTARRSRLESRHKSRILTATATGAVIAAGLFILLCAFALPVRPNAYGLFHKLANGGKIHDIDSWCPLPDPVSPSNHVDSIPLPQSSQFAGEEWIQKQVERLSAAINVPTESFDDNGDVDDDPRWKTFDKFHRVLQELFPNVYALLLLLFFLPRILV